MAYLFPQYVSFRSRRDVKCECCAPTDNWVILNVQSDATYPAVQGFCESETNVHGRITAAVVFTIQLRDALLLR